MVYVNVEQIREKLIKDGWRADASFEELSWEEAEEKGYFFALRGIAKGKKFFKMSANGNIYNEQGKVVYFNIKIALAH